MSLVSQYQRRMDNRLALPKGFNPSGQANQVAALTKTAYNNRSPSPR